MAQVPALTTGDLPEEYRATFERITGAFSRNANLPPVYFNCPEIAQFIFGMGAEFREKEILPTRLVEIIVVTVSKIKRPLLHGASLEPRRRTRHVGGDLGEYSRTRSGPGSTQRKTVRDYASLAVERPAGHPHQVYADMKTHFNDREITAITMRANLASMFNKINMALQIEMKRCHGSYAKSGSCEHVPAPRLPNRGRRL